MITLDKIQKRNLAYSLATGFLMAFAYPPFKTGFLGYVALIPFFILLEGKTLRETLRWSYLTGFLISVFTLFWIGHVTQAGLVGALLIIPLYLTAYGFFHTLILRLNRPYLLPGLPFLWISMEYAQSLTELAFPWNYLGYTQSYYVPLIQFAEFTGILGISFWVVSLNLIFWYLLRHAIRKQHRIGWGAAVVLWFLVPLLFGLNVLRTGKAPQKTVTIALVQGNVDPFEKWEEGGTDKNLSLYEDMTRQAIQQHPDLIVWPETALPFYLRAEPPYLRRVLTLADSTRTPLLTGGLDYKYEDEQDYVYYNTAFLIEPGERYLQSYYKMQLVPMSERVPYRDYFPFKYIKKLLFDMALGIGDYARGQQWTVFTCKINQPSSHGQETTPAAQVRFSVPICYESVFPDLVRKFRQAGAQFLVIITNDAWFGRTTAPYQHAQFAVFRAIENRIPIARCANTGVSCFVDAFGRVYNSSKIFQPAVVVDTIKLCDKRTLYSQHGDWFAKLCAIIAAGMMLIVIPISLRRGDRRAQTR